VGPLVALLLAAALLAILLAGARLWWVSLRGPEDTPAREPPAAETAQPPMPAADSPGGAASPAPVQSVSSRGVSAPQGTHSIRLAWDRSPEPSVTGYRILFGTGSGQYFGSLDVGYQTAATLGGLESGTRYYIVAVAVDASGNQSPPSNELEVMTPAQ
jgi:hypothetical protein